MKEFEDIIITNVSKMEIGNEQEHTVPKFTLITDNTEIPPSIKTKWNMLVKELQNTKLNISMSCNFPNKHQ